jgi:general secretion pathway protein N
MPTDTPWRWAVLGGLLGGPLAALAFAPALWLADGLSAISGGQLQLAQSRGTVWDGSAGLLLTGGADSRDASTLPGRISWRIRPAWLGLRLSLQADCCTREPIELQAGLRWGGWQLRSADATSQWPAAMLAGLGTPWNTLQPQGTLSLSSEALSVEWLDGRLRLGGSARIEALDISSRLSTLRPMGSYRITLHPGTSANVAQPLSPSSDAFGPPTLELQTLQGALRLSGNGQWVGSRLRFRGEAVADPEREAALANLLNIIGRRDGARTIITVG